MHCETPRCFTLQCSVKIGPRQCVESHQHSLFELLVLGSCSLLWRNKSCSFCCVVFASHPWYRGIWGLFLNIPARSNLPAAPFPTCAGGSVGWHPPGTPRWQRAHTGAAPSCTGTSRCGRLFPHGLTNGSYSRKCAFSPAWQV